MSDADPDRTPPRRWVLGAIALMHAVVFAWAARSLPWPDFSIVGMLFGLLGVTSLATAAAAVSRKRTLLKGVWLAHAALGLLSFAYFGWGLLSAAWYVGSSYRGLGEGVAAALAVVCGLVAVVLLPLPLWGLATYWPAMRPRLMGAALILPLLGAGPPTAAREVLVTDAASETFESELQRRLDQLEPRPTASEKAHLRVAERGPTTWAPPPPPPHPNNKKNTQTKKTPTQHTPPKKKKQHQHTHQTPPNKQTPN
ncbi:MAG: hypothetical protein AAGA56_27800, partial [Myxococcota bacterium]